MHEEALLADLRRKLEEVARTQGADRITRATVRIGALSHLSGPVLTRRWGEIVQGTAAAGAVLQIERALDPTDPRAQSIVLVDVAIEEPSRPGPGAAPKRG